MRAVGTLGSPDPRKLVVMQSTVVMAGAGARGKHGSASGESSRSGSAGILPGIHPLSGTWEIMDDRNFQVNGYE
jgi:hypothetical protein